MPRIDPRCGRNAHPGPAEGLDPWRVGWSGPGRAAGVAFAVARGVAAARAGPDRVGSRARRSGAAARAALARGRGPSSGGRRRPEEMRHDWPTASDRVSGLWGSRPILVVVVRGSWPPSAARRSSPRPASARSGRSLGSVRIGCPERTRGRPPRRPGRVGGSVVDVETGRWRISYWWVGRHGRTRWRPPSATAPLS